MTSDQNNTESSNPINLSIPKKEDSLDPSSIKEMIFNTISSPDTIKALAEALHVINKPANNAEPDNRLQSTKDLEVKAKAEIERETQEREISDWFKLQNQIKSIPYTHENNRVSVLKTLEGICENVDDKSKDLSIKRASNLSKLAILKTELNIHTDPYIRNHPKFNEIKDLYEKSNVESDIIVAEEMLEEMYTYTTTQMKAKEQENAIAEKEKLNQYNKNEGLSYELDLKNISLADAIKFKLHGANRYNKSYKNLTTDDYLKVSRNKNHNYNVHALKRDKNREINALVI